MDQIGAKSVKFLNAVRYYGGEANISEIRSMTGLNRNETNYRFRKLPEMGLINITTEPSPGDLEDRKVAHLTGKARRELERGMKSATEAGLIISEESEATEVSRERFREVEQKLNQLTQSQQASRVESRELKTLRDQVFAIENNLTDLEEYIYEWHESAETYLRALRKVVEEKLGVSLQSYLQAGEEDVEEDMAESD